MIVPSTSSPLGPREPLAAANTRHRAPSDRQAAFGALPTTQKRYQGSRTRQGPTIVHVQQPCALVEMLPIDDPLILRREYDRTWPNTCVAPTAIACVPPPGASRGRDEPRLPRVQAVRCSCPCKKITGPLRDLFAQ